MYFCIDGDQNIHYACPDIKFIDCAASMSRFVALTSGAARATTSAVPLLAQFIFPILLASAASSRPHATHFLLASTTQFGSPGTTTAWPASALARRRLTDCCELFSSGFGDDYTLLQDDDSSFSEFLPCSLTSGRRVSFVASSSEHVVVGNDMISFVTSSRFASIVSDSSELKRDSAASKCCFLL